MDERTKQFKEAAESHLKGDPLRKEIATLRRFLFRNQEYRFTKSAQSNIYMAVLAHHANPAAGGSGDGEPLILPLLDDALKMPFTVFTSSQKDKLLQLYWSVLGDAEGAGKESPAGGKPAKTKQLLLVDVGAEGDNELSLMYEDGSEYVGGVSVADAAEAAKLRAAINEGASVIVTIRETADGGAVEYVGFALEDE